MYFTLPLKTISFVLSLLATIPVLYAQEGPIKPGGDKQQSVPDDPSQFISRLELFNEFHRFDKDDYYLNMIFLHAMIGLQV